jgi:TonB family protein
MSLVLAGCATGGPTLQTGFGGPSTNKPHPATPAFPSRISAAEFPSARRIAPRLLVEGAMTAAIDVCVRPSGDTASVRLRESSGDVRFDTAVLEDVRTWKYEAGSELACEQATIHYVP